MPTKTKKKAAVKKPKTELYLTLEGSIFLEERTVKGGKLVEKTEMPGEQCLEAMLKVVMEATELAATDPEGFKKVVAAEKAKAKAKK